MKNAHFDLWCHNATRLIGFGPDRKEVYQELMEHLEDHQAELLAQGMDEDTATEQTLEAMGDPKAIASQLGWLHRPFWGYFLQVSKIVLVVLLCLCSVLFSIYWSKLDLGKPQFRDFRVYERESYGGDTGRTLLHLSKPTGSFSTDGSRFTLTDAAVFTEYSEYYEKEMTYLYVQIRQTSWLPWTEQDQFNDFFPVSCAFHAVDSLGNYYPSYFESSGSTTLHMCSMGNQTGIFSYTHECWINDFQGAEAEWVDICYERDGRSYSLRIYLTGGDGA